MFKKFFCTKFFKKHFCFFSVVFLVFKVHISVYFKAPHQAVLFYYFVHLASLFKYFIHPTSFTAFFGMPFLFFFLKNTSTSCRKKKIMNFINQLRKKYQIHLSFENIAKFVNWLERKILKFISQAQGKNNEKFQFHKEWLQWCVYGGGREGGRETRILSMFFRMKLQNISLYCEKILGNSTISCMKILQISTIKRRV